MFISLPGSFSDRVPTLPSLVAVHPAWWPDATPPLPSAQGLLAFTEHQSLVEFHGGNSFMKGHNSGTSFCNYSSLRKKWVWENEPFFIGVIAGWDGGKKAMGRINPDLSLDLRRRHELTSHTDNSFFKQHRQIIEMVHKRGWYGSIVTITTSPPHLNSLSL